MGKAQVRVTKQSIHTRAHVYARIVNLLFAERKLSGRLVAASRGARYLSLGIRLDNPLKLEAALGLAEPLALAANTPAVLAQRLPDQPGLVTYQFQLAWGYWKTYTRSDVTGLGVGLAENHKQVDFSFDPPHALVAGTSGSGKSQTVKSILCGLFTTYYTRRPGRRDRRPAPRLLRDTFGTPRTWRRRSPRRRRRSAWR